MPSVHWENKLYCSPSMSLILANIYDSNTSHIFLQKLFILHMEYDHLLFKHIPSSYQEPSRRLPAKKPHDWILINHIWIKLSPGQQSPALLTAPCDKHANSFRSATAAGIAGAGFEYYYVKVHYLGSIL